MQRTGCSPRLWDYRMKYNAELISRMVSEDWRPLLEKLIEDTNGLLEYLDFDFYDPV